LTDRLNILPEPAFAALKPQLVERLTHLGDHLHVAQFGALLDPLARRVLAQGFTDAGAHEGTVWLLDEAGENLVPAFNTGPDAEQIVGSFKQPLSSGLICMVFATERPFLENAVWQRAQQSKLLDAQLGTQTCAMIAVPFCCLRACRGVVSCVQLKRAHSPAPDPPGFRPEHLARVEHATALLARLIEFRLLSQAVGWAAD
jgi:hypothetical protein